jgi:hypothetical protein
VAVTDRDAIDPVVAADEQHGSSDLGLAADLTILLGSLTAAAVSAVCFMVGDIERLIGRRGDAGAKRPRVSIVRKNGQAVFHSGRRRSGSV